MIKTVYLKNKSLLELYALHHPIDVALKHFCGKKKRWIYKPFSRYGSLNAKVACTYQSLAFNFDSTCSREIETNDSMIILLFRSSSMSLSNQNIINQNYIENEDLEESTFAFNQPYLGKGLLVNPSPLQLNGEKR